jgi:hypothetical protein
MTVSKYTNVLVVVGGFFLFFVACGLTKSSWLFWGCGAWGAVSLILLSLLYLSKAYHDDGVTWTFTVHNVFRSMELDNILIFLFWPLYIVYGAIAKAIFEHQNKRRRKPT